MSVCLSLRERERERERTQEDQSVLESQTPSDTMEGGAESDQPGIKLPIVFIYW